MKARAMLRFLPACAAGLLAGWLVCHWLAESSVGISVRTLAAPPASTRSSEASWRALLGSRAPAATANSAAGAIGGMRGADTEFRHSPLRATVLKQDLLHLLSAGELAALLESGEKIDSAQTFRIFERLTQLDPPLAFSVALRHPRGGELSDAPRMLCHAWVRRDANAALKAIKALPAGMVRSAWAGALGGEWARADPAAALDHLDELAALGNSSRENGQKLDWAAAILDQWMLKDLPAAKQWIAGLSDAALREKLEISLLKIQAAIDPAGAVAAAFQRRDVSGMEREIGEMWRTFYNKDSAAALQALGQLPEEHSLWQHLDDMTFRMLVYRGPIPREQLPELAAQLPEGPRRDKFLAGFVHAGASIDIPFALKALPLMSEGPEREQAAGGLTEVWMRKDPVKTSEWLASLPADADSRHAGVARFAENLAPDDPERAAQWATTLPDSYGRKQDVIKTVLEKWRAKDPAAAEAWLAALKPRG